MGDVQGCMWRGAILLVAVTRDHFSEVVVMVRNHATPEAVTITKRAVLDNSNNNATSLGLIAVLLVLLGIEQVLLYLNSANKQATSPHTRDGKQEEKVLSLEPAVTTLPNKQQQEQQLVECLSTAGSSFLSILDDVRAGIPKFPPQRAEDGTSGVYFFKNGFDRKVAVFKPSDEEGINLDGYTGGELKPGCMPGEGSLKEVAAYLLDKDGYHGVPNTALVKCAHDTFGNNPKVGSLQEYISYESTAEDMGWGKFSTRDVHKIGLLDCRILNLDRHLGNILVTEEEGEYGLVPIDHAFSLPSTVTAGSFEWLQFPQCKKPFDEETVNYVCNIDVDSDVQMLRRQLPTMKEECIETMKMCTLFVKKAVARRFTLYEIGCMMSRYLDDTEMSELEKMYIRIKERLAQGPGELWRIVDEEIDQTLANRQAL